MLNDTLEHCIGERVRELEQARLFLDVSHREKRAQYLSAVKVFSGLTELRSPQLGAHSKRVAELARFIAIELNCDPDLVYEVYIAGLLHDVGKIGLTDEALFTSVANLTTEFRAKLMSHSIKGQMLFDGLSDMEPISVMIRHHHERFDGDGYPDGIFGEVIPLGSRILAVAEDFDELKLGWLTPQKLSEQEALSFIMKSGDSRYDPKVVAVFPTALEKLRAAPRLEEKLVSGSELRVGQTLSRDFVGPDGYLWLSKEKLVTKHLIDHIKENEKQKGIHVDFVNGYEDHCHCLISLGINQSVEKVMQLIKGESSYWINQNPDLFPNLKGKRFEWQSEFFALSVSESILKRVRNYIKNQEAHHCKKSFEDEYVQIRNVFKKEDTSD